MFILYIQTLKQNLVETFKKAISSTPHTKHTKLQFPKTFLKTNHFAFCTRYSNHFFFHVYFHSTINILHILTSFIVRGHSPASLYRLESGKVERNIEKMQSGINKTQTRTEQSLRGRDEFEKQMGDITKRKKQWEAAEVMAPLRGHSTPRALKVTNN